MGKCFIGHAFSKKQIDDFREAMQEVLRDVHLEPIFGDDEFSSESLREKVERMIRSADVCIFEVSQKERASVFVEVGYAQACGKRIVMLLENEASLPSNLQGAQYLRYESYRDVKLKLPKLLESILSRRPPIPTGPYTVGFDLTLSSAGQAVEREQFFDEVTSAIRGARSYIYRSGRGIMDFTPDREMLTAKLIEATDRALRQNKDLRIVRLQTSKYVAPEWAEAYAGLMETHRDRLSVYRDFDNPSLVNVAVIDPGPSGVIQLLFEAEDPRANVDRFRSAAGVVVYNQPTLTTTLQRQFESRTDGLRKLRPEEFRRLGQRHQLELIQIDAALDGDYELYFAYGTNLSSRQMVQREFKRSKIVGPATLYEWVLRFDVPGVHGSGAAAGIYPELKAHVFGVVYAMTPEEKRSLDDKESPGYRPERVNVKLKGHQHHPEVWAYLPDTNRGTSPGPAGPDYLDAMIDGADEHGLSELSRDLRKMHEIRPLLVGETVRHVEHGSRLFRILDDVRPAGEQRYFRCMPLDDEERLVRATAGQLAHAD